MSKRNAPSSGRYIRINDLLEKYLSGNSAAEDTAQKLASNVQEDEQNVNAELLWNLFILTARKSPEHHEKLTDLLSTITRLPPVKSGDKVIQDWSSLPKIGWEFNYEYNGLQIPDAPAPNRATVAKEYANSNLFAAHIMSRDPPLTDLKLFCIWAMRPALETPYADEQLPGPLGVYLPGAAAWITVAAEQVYGWDTEFPHGGNQGQPAKGGPLWDGKQGFCAERWALWRKRFGELAKKEGLGEELGEVAGRAEERMREVEG